MAASLTASTHIDRFLAEATTEGTDDGNSLRKDQLYGLYISWCLLHDAKPIYFSTEGYNPYFWGTPAIAASLARGVPAAVRQK